MVVQLIPRSFSSCKTETLHAFNYFPFVPSLFSGGHHSTFYLYFHYLGYDKWNVTVLVFLFFGDKFVSLSIKFLIRVLLEFSSSFRLNNILLCVLSCISHVWLFATPWTVVLQAPLAMGVSRQEYWSGLPFPFPGDLPDPGIKPSTPTSPALQADSLPLSHQGSPIFHCMFVVPSINVQLFYCQLAFEFFPHLLPLELSFLRSGTVFLVSLCSQCLATWSAQNWGLKNIHSLHK